MKRDAVHWRSLIDKPWPWSELQAANICEGIRQGQFTAAEVLAGRHELSEVQLSEWITRYKHGGRAAFSGTLKKSQRGSRREA